MSDNITQNLSKELYRYMCLNIVGTEEHVKQIRLLNASRDSLLNEEHRLSITSGSFGEGLEMRGSDLDIMFVRKNIEVYVVKPHCVNPNMSYLSIDTNAVKPGFTKLRLKYTSSQTLLANCVQFTNKYYLSSKLCYQLVDTTNLLKIHGPCIADMEEAFDIADCLHCKTWVASAAHWITRSTNAWPNYNVKQSIINHGVLFVPIGVKGSSNEDIEWRISFSIGEKLLINTFTHTQLLCYVLMKILLKDVIASYSECKDFLCSYFLKSIIFWISEELPQSVWKPDNLIPCFMRCFSRLVYCVEYSVCLHYFIPQNNLFENKMEGCARKVLLEKLKILHSYGWRCILFSDQVYNVAASMNYLNMDYNELCVYNITKITNSFLFQLAKINFRWSFNVKNISFSSWLKGIIQKAVTSDKSFIKYVYTYFMSIGCSLRAQRITLNSTYSNNKSQYRQYKSCLSTLLQNIYHDAVSGWLMIASFFYKIKQYGKALRIIMYTLSKCTFERQFPSMKMSEIHHLLNKLKPFKKKSIVHLWKFVFIDSIIFERNSMLIPFELQIEVDQKRFFIPSLVYACFLHCLCHYQLNNVRQCHYTIKYLQLVIKRNYLIGGLGLKAVANNILGVAFQLLGDT
ncbi:uncharacterized protein [Mytilus edulis]|uniref:uncharacterized protein n=1 Tax=Mytilus edulis TaxID=6550 RepID=UPI0039EEF77B